METITRIREQGTVETIAGNGLDRIKAIQEVVDNKQYAKIDGCMIDGFSAQAILKVYNALSEENKIKYANIPAGKMGIIAWELIK